MPFLTMYCAVPELASGGFQLRKTCSRVTQVELYMLKLPPCYMMMFTAVNIKRGFILTKNAVIRCCMVFFFLLYQKFTEQQPQQPAVISFRGVISWPCSVHLASQWLCFHTSSCEAV